MLKLIVFDLENDEIYCLIGSQNFDQNIIPMAGGLTIHFRTVIENTWMRVKIITKNIDLKFNQELINMMVNKGRIHR